MKEVGDFAVRVVVLLINREVSVTIAFNFFHCLNSKMADVRVHKILIVSQDALLVSRPLLARAN